MTIKLDDASVYTDFRSLDTLRQAAEKNTPEALTAVAKQFEALFLQQILKGMRDSKLADGLMDSDAGDLYQDMFDKQIALNLAQGKGIGLADLLVEQLRSNAPNTTTRGEDTISSTLPSIPAELKMPTLPKVNPSSPTTSLPRHIVPILANVTDEQTPMVPVAIGASTQEFLSALWEPAKQAADALNVDVRVLLAQSALETGWGQFVTRHTNGDSSNNLFNIKADSHWQGGAVSKPTLEFKDGIAQQEQARFRAYHSVAECFADYVSFLQQNPRYSQTLQLTGQQKDSVGFIQNLQAAGYATDPDYAKKVVDIASSERMNEAMAALKLSSDRPLPSLEGLKDEL